MVAKRYWPVYYLTQSLPMYSGHAYRLAGGCFKQVILYRVSANGTSSSDHNREVAALWTGSAVLAIMHMQ